MGTLPLSFCRAVIRFQKLCHSMNDRYTVHTYNLYLCYITFAAGTPVRFLSRDPFCLTCTYGPEVNEETDFKLKCIQRKNFVYFVLSYRSGQTLIVEYKSK